MKRRFIKERTAWIAFIFFLHGFIFFIASIDPSLDVQHIGYPLLLSSILFIIFIVFRSHKESRFYRQLEQYDQHEQLSDLPDGQSPFETIVETAFEEQRNHLFQKYMTHRQQVDNDKDEMMAWIHEVKTPLTTMGLIIDRLEEKEAKTALHLEWLRIHLLLDQQLYHKRMDFIENDLYLDKVELESVFHQEIRTFQQWCMQKGIGIELELKEPFVYSDAKWLAFLIRQVLSNAVKYSHSGDIFISSQTHNGQIELVVKDEGKGIAEQDLSRIFEKGFTSTTFHHEQAASGMGLYLAKKVADGLAVQLTVQSTLGKGTTVTMLFPRKNQFTSLTSM